MVWSLLERLGGKPVVLFTFARGSEVWRYCTARSAVTLNALTYSPAVIEHEEISDSEETAESEITITLALNTPVVDELLKGTPSYRRTVVTIQRYQSDASGGALALVATGEVTSVKFKDGVVSVTAAQVTNALTILTPRLTFQRTCNNNLYDGACMMRVEDFSFDGTVASISVVRGGSQIGAKGSSIIVAVSGAAAAQPAGYFTAGFFKFGDVPAAIEVHTVSGGNAVLGVMGPLPPGMAVGSSVVVVAGCQKRYEEDCIAKFDNAEHFIGFPDMPNRNPFDTGLA